MIRGLYKYYLSPESFVKSSFMVNAGETARGVRFILSNFKDTSDLKFKNIIKIDEELFENENVTFDKADGYVDVLFPSLSTGEYLSELVISDGDKKLLSGVFKIQYQESLSGENAKNLKKIIDEDFESTLKKINEVKEFLNTIQLENLATKEYVEEQIKEKSTKIEIVNNLEDGGADKALSAEQGKELFQCVSNGKKQVVSAVTDIGYEIDETASFDDIAGAIYSCRDLIELNLRESLGKFYKVGDTIKSDDLEPIQTIKVGEKYSLENLNEEEKIIKWLIVEDKLYYVTNKLKFVVCMISQENDIYSAKKEKEIYLEEAVNVIGKDDVYMLSYKFENLIYVRYINDIYKINVNDIENFKQLDFNEEFKSWITRNEGLLIVTENNIFSFNLENNNKEVFSDKIQDFLKNKRIYKAVISYDSLFAEIDNQLCRISLDTDNIESIDSSKFDFEYSYDIYSIGYDIVCITMSDKIIILDSNLDYFEVEAENIYDVAVFTLKDKIYVCTARRVFSQFLIDVNKLKFKNKQFKKILVNVVNTNFPVLSGYFNKISYLNKNKIELIEFDEDYIVKVLR